MRANIWPHFICVVALFSSKLPEKIVTQPLSQYIIGVWHPNNNTNDNICEISYLIDSN